MGNRVELLENGIIYVEQVGDQTERTMAGLYKKVGVLTAELRAQNKSVLILSNAEREGKMSIGARRKAVEIGEHLDYDKSATYGSSVYLHNLRTMMLDATSLHQKVANFKTKAEALDWLLR